MPKAKSIKLENAMQQLEDILEKLEDEDIPLEDSIKIFEEGISLTRAAQKLLVEAEQKVQLLLEEDGEPQSSALSPAGDQ